MQEKQGELHDLLINYVHGREAKVAEEEDAMQWKREKQGKFFYRKKCEFGSHGTIQPLIPQAEQWRTLQMVKEERNCTKHSGYCIICLLLTYLILFEYS